MSKVYPVFNKDKQKNIETLLEKTNKRNYLLWLVGTHTGLRISDIVTLKVLDLKGAVLSIREKKTGKIKTINISNKLKKVLKDYISDNNLNDNSNLFTSRQSKEKPMTIRRVQQIIKAVGKICNIEENINSHSLRKTFAYNLYTLSNNNIALVMEALNHTKESITLKYLCIKEKLLNELINEF